jgi:hypothetical protein
MTLQDTAGKRTFAASNGSVGGAAAQKTELFPGFRRHSRRKPGNSFIHGAGEARDTSALARVCRQYRAGSGDAYRRRYGRLIDPRA